MLGGAGGAEMPWHNVTSTPLLHPFDRKGLIQQQTLTDALLITTALSLCFSPSGSQ